MSDERDRLLAATVEHATAHGISELSLRQLAAALGTSHRMLVYYFGSKEELLVEVTKAVEAQQRASLEQLAVADGADPEAQMRAMWRRLTDPALWPQERLFFELYGQALQGRPHATSLLDGVVDDWIGPMTDVLVRQGVPKATARAEARLALAVTRGLLLDLLATGDRKGVNAAMARFGELRAGDR